MPPLSRSLHATTADKAGGSGLNIVRHILTVAEETVFYFYNIIMLSDYRLSKACKINYFGIIVPLVPTGASREREILWR